MPRLSALVAVLVACVSLAAFGCGGDGEGDRLSGPGFAADLPGGWEEGGIAEDLAVSGVEGEFSVDIAAVGVRQDADDGFRSNVNVALDDVPAGTTLEELAEASRSGLEGNTGNQSIDENIDVTLLTEPEPLTVAGERALSYEYENEIAAGDLQQRAVLILRDSRAYSITFSAREDAFEERMEEFEQVLASWRWKGS